jgi:hypothetical protein
MPTPAEAAAILRAHFGMQTDPQTGDTYGDPTGAVALGVNRTSLQNELDDRIRSDAFAAMLPQEGFVPGEPGRRYVSRLPAANLADDVVQSTHLQRDQADDPFTGTAEQARVGGIQKALDTAATIQRPEIGDAAKTVAARNAFAEYMKSKGMKMGEFEAAGSPAGLAAAMTPINASVSDAAQTAKDLDLERQQRLRMSPQLVPGQMPADDTGDGGVGGFTFPPNLKLSDADSKTINSMRGLSHMVGDLKSMLDPTQNQVTNRASQTVRLALYNMGISPDIAGLGDERSQARIQLADLIKVMGAAPFMSGSRNYQYMKDIYRHLTNPAASDAFLYNQLNELEKRWPQIHQAIIQTRLNPAAPLDFSPTASADPWSTPPTPDELRR